MTVVQRYRHLRVLPAETLDGTDRYRPADRAALIKKALTLVYGPAIAAADPGGALALLSADLATTISHLQIEVGNLNERARRYRNDHTIYGQSQSVDEPVVEDVPL